ncbi:sodium/proline symporter PutP [candidate division KSB1 bacterium]|nr:sodium/proline symporter PutP [candidate division KSB1 bacterium]
MILENPGILISFLFYLVLMLLIGWYFYNRTNNLSDYILGGRGLNTWVASLSAQASDMSGWLLLGLPGFAYLAGMESIWMTAGLALGTYLNWKFIAARLRKYTEIAGNSITLPVYFENRFKMKTPLIRIISAIFILAFFLIYTASGFVAGAKLFNTVFGIQYHYALLTGMFVIISYTFLGGFMAVSWTDFFQGTLIFIAILVVPVLTFRALSVQGESLGMLSNELPGYFNIFKTASGEKLSVISIISLAAWGLGYFGQPHILSRFMAIKSQKQIRPARFIAMVWVIMCLAGALLIGMTGRAYIDRLLDKTASETIFMLLVNELVHPLFSGFLLAAILAAIMSTADSQLLVASSAVTEDLYRLIFRRKVQDKELVWISRFVVLVIAIIACIIGMNPDSSVLELVAYAWAGFGATFGPIILLSLFWNRMTGSGALAGMAVGGLTVLFWKQFSGGLFDIYEIVPGFLFSVVIIIFVSLLDKQPSPDVLREFSHVTTNI